jgi:hypothetical protein
MIRMPAACRLSISLLLCVWSMGWAGAASVPSSEPPIPPTVGLPGAPGSSPARVQTPVPALPGTKTAADTFRELLEMSPEQLAQALASRTEYQRKHLEARLREYQQLSPDQRATRLKQFELTCHLDNLMRLAPSNRTARLAAVPPDLRPAVDQNLKEWDLLPPKVQQEALEYKTTANFFLRVRGVRAATPGATQAISPPLTPPGSDDKPGRMAEYLNQFLELPKKERQKTLEALPASEREVMEQTLRVFANLPLEQRKICVNSFDKFSRLTKQERDQFLKNATRWQTMSPQERETWRTLIQIVPPNPPVSNPVPLPSGASVVVSNGLPLP